MITRWNILGIPLLLSIAMLTPMTALAQPRACPPGSEHPGAICFAWAAAGFALGLGAAVGVFRRAKKEPRGHNPWAHVITATGLWFALTATGLFFSFRCLLMCF